MDAWYKANPLYEQNVQGSFSGVNGTEKYAMNNQQWGTATAQDYAMQQIKRLLGDKFDPNTMKAGTTGALGAGSPYSWDPQRTININGNDA